MKKALDEAILEGNRRAAARLMRLIDDAAPGARQFLCNLLPHTGDAYILGVTGNPGSGKSTLVSELIYRFRQQGDTVGCIAVDPTSPFSGGAILGDRVRMQDHADDDGVFIRSVATRGHLGGLARSTPAMIQIFDAMGFDVIIVETVGVGQDEVEIVRLADTNLVVLVPGLGDDVQAEKPGLMEIADLFVLNKSDRPGSKHLKRQIRTMLSLHDVTDTKAPSPPPILSTEATTGRGLPELFDAIRDHRTRHRNLSADARNQRRYTHLVRAIARSEMDQRFQAAISTHDFAESIDQVVDGKIDPYEAANRLLERLSEPSHNS